MKNGEQEVNLLTLIRSIDRNVSSEEKMKNPTQRILMLKMKGLAASLDAETPRVTISEKRQEVA